jgi:hypothetical protein
MTPLPPSDVEVVVLAVLAVEVDVVVLAVDVFEVEVVA